MEKLQRIFVKPLIAFGVRRVLGANLIEKPRLVAAVIEGIAVFPKQAIERVHIQELDIVLKLASAEVEEFLQRGRIGDHSRPRIEGEPVLLIDIGAPAKAVAFFKQDGLNPRRLQPNSEREPAEARTDYCCFCHYPPCACVVARAARARFRYFSSPRQPRARLTGTGGFPARIRA